MYGSVLNVHDAHDHKSKWENMINLIHFYGNYVSTGNIACLKHHVKNKPKISNAETHKIIKPPSLRSLRLGGETCKSSYAQQEHFYKFNMILNRVVHAVKIVVLVVL